MLMQQLKPEQYLSSLSSIMLLSTQFDLHPTTTIGLMSVIRAKLSQLTEMNLSQSGEKKKGQPEIFSLPILLEVSQTLLSIGRNNWHVDSNKSQTIPKIIIIIRISNIDFWDLHANAG
ncbi:hypothetical protein ACB098_11G159200 [Castanea mollissima]